VKKVIIIVLLLMTLSAIVAAGIHQKVVADRLAAQDPHNVNVQEYLPDGVELQQVYYAKIMSKDYTDVVIQSKPKAIKPLLNEYYISVLSYDNATNKFEKKFETTLRQSSLQLLTGTVFDDGRDVFITSFREGSGGFLNYNVYGAIDNNVGVLLQRSGIFQGNVWINAAKVVESSSDQAKYFAWDGNAFQATPVLLGLERNTYQPEDQKVEYWIDDKQNIILTSNIVHLRKGQRLYLVRTKFGVSTRIMYSNKQLQLTKDDFGQFYVASEVGDTFVTIIPNGYSWDKAQKINITISE